MVVGGGQSQIRMMPSFVKVELKTVAVGLEDTVARGRRLWSEVLTVRSRDEKMPAALGPRIVSGNAITRRPACLSVPAGRSGHQIDASPIALRDRRYRHGDLAGTWHTRRESLALNRRFI
jgi:hypothetical protein